MRAKAVLRLQLLDMRQGPEVAELIRLPTGGLIPDSVGATLRCFSPDGTSRRRVSNRAELAAEVSREGIATAEFEFDAFRRELGPGIEATAAHGTYQLSPTNTAWPSLAVKATSREDEALRASLRSLQTSLNWNEVRMYPTLVEWQVTLRGPATREPWTPLGDALTGAFASPCLATTMTGYGDLSEGGGFQEGVLGRLAPWPRAYPRLAVAFEDLYPALLGSVEVCGPIGQALGCSLREIPTASGEMMGLLEIPDAVLKDKDRRANAAGLLIERSEAMRKRPPEVKSGEHQIGARILFTRRRLHELIAKGAVAPPPEGLAFAPIVDEKHWRVLGLSEDEALMQLWQVPVLDAFRRETEAVPLEEPDTKAHIWDLYSQAFRKRFRSNEVLDYIRRLTEEADQRHSPG